MEDKKVHIIAFVTVFTLIVFIVIIRVSHRHSNAFYLILGADIAVILAVLSCLIIRRRYNRRSKLLVTQLASEGRELRIEYSFLRKVAGVPIKFRFKELEEATGNFQSLLGQGGSASVFKGILSDGTIVAVKRINREERGDKEFRSEVAAIASVQHINLVRLLGYCVVPKGSRFLVYEFIPNGSLDYWIFPPKEDGNQNPKFAGGCLPWESRYRIAIDVAKALSYLHNDCRSKILHLDVKPENILIDENFRAIVADFGLSKLIGKDESKVITNVRGTRGYLAPEWLLGLGVSEKSDVYSFGMVLLEMIGGKRNVSLIRKGKDRSWQYFPKIVNQKMREGKFMEIVDERLIEMGGIDENEVKKLVKIGFWCIQERPRLRPTMASVVEMLEGRVDVEGPPDTQMIVLDLLSIDGEDEVEIGRNKRAAIAALAIRDSSRPTTSFSYSMSLVSPR